MSRTNVEGGAPPVQNANPGQVENLADLAGQAAALDSQAPPAGAPPGTAVSVEVVQEATAKDLADVLRMARDMCAPMVEAMGYLKPGQTRELWSDAVLLSIAEPAMEIMRRHGVGLGEALDKLGPYLGLVIGLWAPCVGTYAAIRENVPAAQAKVSSGEQQQPA